MTIRNANPFTIRFEADFVGDPEDFSDISGKLVQKPGKRIRRATIPASDSARLIFRYSRD